MTTFANLGLPTSLSDVLAAQNITEPTPIQAATLPDSLAGRDVLGRGRTGSGKTYAFLLPLIARLAADRRKPRPGAPRALILAPTRELVTQIEASAAPLARAAGLKTRTVFGGVGQRPQVDALAKGVDIVIACPGRLEDLIGQRHCSLSDIEITVLDEADHMADLGFLPGVRRLLAATPAGSQRLLFSATLDKAVDALVKQFLKSPVTHQADSVEAPVTTMAHHVLHIERDQRVSILTDLASAPGRTVIFTRTKHGAKALARQLNRNGVPSVDLHGNLSQNARVRNLDAFHNGEATALIATDIAARGIHVDDVALVVHADPPAEHKAYLHRSGRTARAGNEGTVVTLMTSDQVRDVRDLTKAAGIKPTTTRIDSPSHPILVKLAPGQRTKPGGYEPAAAAQPERRPAGEGTGTRKSRPGSRARKRQAADGTAPAQRGQGGGKPVGSKQGTGAKASVGNGATKPSGSGSNGGGRRRGGRGSDAGAGSGRPHSAASFSSGRR